MDENLHNNYKDFLPEEEGKTVIKLELRGEGVGDKAKESGDKEITETEEMFRKKIIEKLKTHNYKQFVSEENGQTKITFNLDEE